MRFYQGIDQNTGFTTGQSSVRPSATRRSRRRPGGFNQRGTFDPDALIALTGIGSMAGTAIRHHLLFEKMQAAHHSYQELFEAVLIQS
jgi:hypothetical protein